MVGKVLALRSAGVLPVEEVESLEAPARPPRYSSVLHLVQVWRHGGGGGGDGLVRVEVDTHLQFIFYIIYLEVSIKEDVDASKNASSVSSP